MYLSDGSLTSQYGNIPGALNVPARVFVETVQEFHSQWKYVPLLIFHCALSQVRGPKCAQRYVQSVLLNGDSSQHQSVHVLQGGFSQWQAIHGNNPLLVENYNKEYWDDPW